MKRFLLPIALTLVLSLSSCIIAKPKVLGKIAGHPCTEAVRIPARTFALAGNIAEDESDFVRSIKSLEVVQCGRSTSSKTLDKEFRKIVEDRKMELLISAADSLESVDIYVHFKGKSREVNELLIRTAENDGHNFVYLQGKFDLDKLVEADMSSLTKRVFNN